MQTEDMSLDSASWESLSPGAKERKKALLEKSWVEMFEEEENAMNASLNAERTVEEGEILDDTKEAAATAECPDEDILDIDGESQDLPEEVRDIEIDFIERKNEEKFEKLVKEEKIRTPFKRRLSGESVSEESGESETKRMKEHRVRSSSTSSGSTNNSGSAKTKEFETDPDVLMRRQKQIDFGKNTIGYDNYVNQVPREERKATDPNTPRKNIKYSRRAWDGLIKQWRKQLHAWDPDSGKRKDESTDTKEA
uniref:Histone RNA hairpin-binding protein RNA-binding domain-containing protein n=1 Tax=Lutzomyia longipalpis TaxID=7200 RepID=A0A1B0CLE5_LUTLO